MAASYRSLAAIAGAVVLGISLTPVVNTRFGSLLLVPSAVFVAYAALGRSGDRRPPAGIGRGVEIGLVVIGMLVFVLSLAEFQELEGRAVLFVIVALLVGMVGAGWLVATDRSGGGAWWAFLAAFAGVLVIIVFGVDHQRPLDVAVFQIESVSALINGVNPYGITFLDPYPAWASDVFYGEGVSVDGVLQFGYPYLPLSLLVVTPFEALLGDFRVAIAVATVLAAAMIANLRDDRPSRVAAMVFVLVAPALYLNFLGWMDAIVVAVVVAIVFVASRRPHLGSYGSGVLFAVKQYTAFLILPSLLLVDRPYTTRTVLVHYAKAAVPLILLTMPFFLWSPRAFYESVVALQFRQPFRTDSISIPALAPDVVEGLPWLAIIVIPFAIVIIVSVMVLLRTETGPRGFALGSALVLLVAFALSKQAFANYYIVVIGLLCAGAALDTGGVDEPMSPERLEEPVS